MSSRQERFIAAQKKLRQSQHRLRTRKQPAGHELRNVARLDRKARDIDRNLRRIVGFAILDD